MHNAIPPPLLMVVSALIQWSNLSVTQRQTHLWLDVLVVEQVAHETKHQLCRLLDSDCLASSIPDVPTQQHRDVRMMIYTSAVLDTNQQDTVCAM